MQLNIEFEETAFRHKIKREDILWAFHHYHYDGQMEDDENKFIRIGFDRSGNLLEVMYNERKNFVNIFHAMICRSIYYPLLDL